MTGAILQPGRNCWHIDRAQRVRVIQDAADYFTLVRRALLSARRSIFILGWDLTAGIDLAPGASSREAPTRFDAVLRHAVRRQRQLQVYLLTWDYDLLFTLERDPFSRIRLGWTMPRRVRFAFDDRHPIGASHHQKVVVIDDTLAFCGGIDLTGHRWDTCSHRVEEPRRVTPTGKVYGPYHEVQAMLDGPVAARLGSLARERWRTVGVTDLPPPAASHVDLWPADVTPDFTDVNVALSRTMPGADRASSIRECEALFLDSIAAARRSIYIENQYFTNTKLTEALSARLAEPDGPEVIVAVPRDSHGWLEQKTIGAVRDHVFRQLLAADRFSRLRLVAPVASRLRDVPTFVHSKVTIVDDDFLRIGSANCSHRSMGVDTECDVAIESRGDETIRAGIRRVRDRLLAEHLALPVESATAELARAGSLCAFLDAHRDDDHTLARIALPAEPVPQPSEAVRIAVDPDEPLEYLTLNTLLPAARSPRHGVPARIRTAVRRMLAGAIRLTRTTGLARRVAARTARPTGAEFG